MWIMKLDIFILCTLVIIFQESWCYYVSNTTFTLTKKSDNCEIATPVVHYGNEKLTVDINGHSTKKEVWVGFYQRTALFEYFGCMSSEDLEIPKILLGTPNIGRCYSACSNTPFIGIQRKECYCISDKPVISSIRNPNCNAGCSVFYNAACGGDKVISLYRMLPHNDSKHIPAAKQDNKTCLKIRIDQNNRNKTYEWKYCIEQMPALCTYDSDRSVQLNNEKKSWKDAATLCFQKHGYPIGYEDVRNVLSYNIAKYGWTGIVWSDIIYNETEYRKNSSDISHGYLKYEDSLGYVLHFSKDDDARKYILCKGEPVRKETTMISTKPHSSIPMSKTPETPVTPTGEMKSSSYDSSFDDTDLTVVVGVLVSATLLVVVIVILLVLVKRKKIICCTGGKQLTEVADQKQTKTRSRNSHLNSSYDFVDDECIDASFKGNYDSPDNTYNMPDQDDGNPKEAAYDIACNDRHALKKKQDNTYNKLLSENTPIYDLTNDKSKTEMRAFYDTYNTTEEASMNCVIKLDKHAIGMSTIEDRPYNHTNSDPFERKKVDNVYNTASFQ